MARAGLRLSLGPSRPGARGWGWGSSGAGWRLAARGWGWEAAPSPATVPGTAAPGSRGGRGYSVSGPGYSVSGPGYNVSGPGYVSAPGHSVSGPGLSVSGPGYSVSAPGLRVSGPGYNVSGPGHSVSGPGHSVSGPGHSVSGPGYNVSGPGYNVSGPGHSVSGPGHSVSVPGHSVSVPGHTALVTGHKVSVPGYRLSVSGDNSLGPGRLGLWIRSLATNGWCLAHTRVGAAIHPFCQLSQQRAFNGMIGRGKNAGQWGSGTATSLRELDRVGRWTWLGVIPGAGQVWMTLASRKHHIWSNATPGRLRPTLGTRPVSANVPQDVLLFLHQRASFFRLLGLFCTAQFLFWIYLAHFAFTSLKDTGYEETVLVGDRARSLPKIGGLSLNLGSKKWRYGFTASCLTVGSLILAAGCIFSRRSVCSVLLHRGGQQATISSYQLFGGARSFSVPLRDLSCVAHRSQAASVIPVKVRGHRFYYLLDRQGQFYNVKLFDVTVGAYRRL